MGVKAGAVSLLVAGICWAAITANSPSALAEPLPPTFNTVPDILLGQRLLLEVDDVAISARDDHGNRLLDLAATSNLAITSEFQRGPGAIAHVSLPLAVKGRPFNTPSDTVIDVVGCPSGCAGGPFILFIEYGVGFGTQTIRQAATTLSSSNLPPGAIGQMLGAAMADFNADGYDELVLWYQTGSTQYMQILTASNVNDPNAGLTQVGPWTPVTATQAGSDKAPFVAQPSLTLGDYDGNGVPDIARVAVVSEQVYVVFDTVDATSLAIIAGQLQSLGITGSEDIGVYAAAAAGQFDGSPTDAELMVLIGGKPPAKVALVDVSATLGVTVQAIVDLPGASGDRAGALALPQRIASGRLDASSCGSGTPCTDQAVVLYVPNAMPPLIPQFEGPISTVAIVTFDPQQVALSVAASISTDQSHSPLRCALDMAVGRFAPDPTQTSSGPVYSFDLQVAVLGQSSSSCALETPLNSGPATLAIFDVVAGQSFSFAVSSSRKLDFSVSGEDRFGPPAGAAVLVAGDLQGRSMRVGPPEKVTVGSHTQPDIVLGLPPMHVDFVAPREPFPGCTSASEPCVMNLTVYPSLPPSTSSAAFNTAFSFSTTAQQTATRQSTTSHTFSQKISTTEKVTFGVPSLDSISVQSTQALQQTHATTISSNWSGYASTASSVQSTTGFADHVFFSTYDLNMYYYPVIGQYVCPTGASSCPSSDLVPLYVAFSGPDSVQPSDADATTQEWYQPGHEPGNILSYPCDLPALYQLNPGFTPLTTDPAPWQEIDVSTTAYTASWTGGTSAGQSSGTTNTHSLDWSVTVSGHGSFEGGSASASASFEEASSTSVATVNSSTQSLSASTGVIVTRPAFPQQVADDFFYWFGGYVMGVTPPLRTVQTLTPTDGQGNPVSIQSTGPLVVGFVANPVLPNESQAPWWPDAYSVPDVAVLHPARWDWTKSTQTVSFNAATSDPPMEQDFYRMKGFHIVAGDVPVLPDGAFQGPTLSQATDGDQLKLVVRVYNYSLAPMPSGSTVAVRFYAQQVNGGATVGPSILVSEVSGLPPIPPFPGASCSSDPNNPSAPNWVNVATTFDTTGRAPSGSATYWLFWVVAWMQNANGTLGEEMPEHGLASNPADKTFTDPSQVPIQPYSNNVGLYGSYSPFVINPRHQPTAPTPSKPGDLAIAAMTVRGEAGSAISIPLDKKVPVAVDLVTPASDVGSHLVGFYDGVPGQGGTAFDFIRVARVSAGSPYRARTYFRPQTCGPHTLVAVAAPERGAAAVSGHVSVDVTMDPLPAVDALIRSALRLGLTPSNANRVFAALSAARTALQQGNTAGAGQLLAIFEAEVANVGGKPTAEQLDVLVAQSKLFRSCITDVELSGTVTALSGRATRVGDASDAGQVRMTGTLVLTPAAGGLDLGNARVSIHSLLDETAGAGELVDRVAAGSVQLIARAGGKPTAATYESVPAGARPSFRMEMKQRSGGLIQFTLKVDRAVLSREPLLCTAARPSTTELVTRFAIEDDVHPALAIATTRRWECEGGPPQAPSELKLR